MRLSFIIFILLYVANNVCLRVAFVIIYCYVGFIVKLFICRLTFILQIVVVMSFVLYVAFISN